MAETQNSHHHHRKIQRVPLLLLEEEKNKYDYYPKVVSIGPYHHGKVALASVEVFKPKAVDLFTSGGGQQSTDHYYNKILDIIDDVRKYYKEVSIADYDNEKLAKMMLHDACLLIIYMEISAPSEKQYQRKLKRNMQRGLDRLTMANLLRDFLLLENQIPLRVIKLLIDLRQREGEDEYQKLLDRFMNMTLFDENRPTRVSQPERAEPLHLLEAFHRLVVSDCVAPAPPPMGGGGAAAPTQKEKREDPEIGVDPSITSANLKKASNSKNSIKNFFHSFRSVTDLKAKGIYFKPSPTQSLKDVNFKSHNARLELPEWGVCFFTKVFFLNLVAYELSPNNPTKAEVASYINFMKSLIGRPEDVKELREKKIFYTMLGSDEEIVSIYRDINTYGADNSEIFKHVKQKIQAHYNSRTKMWMAELIHTNFRSPWTVTAFLVAVVLLAISAGQLYYAVHPNQ